MVDRQISTFTRQIKTDNVTWTCSLILRISHWSLDLLWNKSIDFLIKTSKTVINVDNHYNHFHNRTLPIRSSQHHMRKLSEIRGKTFPISVYWYLT